MKVHLPHIQISLVHFLQRKSPSWGKIDTGTNETLFWGRRNRLGRLGKNWGISIWGKWKLPFLKTPKNFQISICYFFTFKSIHILQTNPISPAGELLKFPVGQADPEDIDYKELMDDET